MKLDVDGRLAAGFIFGLAGLTVETIGGLLGLPVSTEIVGACSSIVIATFTIGVLSSTGKRRGDDD